MKMRFIGVTLAILLIITLAYAVQAQSNVLDCTFRLEQVGDVWRVISGECKAPPVPTQPITPTPVPPTMTPLPPTATPIPPTPTETPVSITPTAVPPTPPPGNVQPYVGAPACPSHDPTVWHGLWDSVRGCHYDHEHGSDPATMNGVFGPWAAQWGGQQISYPWQTYHSGEHGVTYENDAKHGGYKI